MKLSPQLFLITIIFLLVGTEGFRWWWFSRSKGDDQDKPYLAWTPPDHAIDKKFAESGEAEVLNHDFGQQVLVEGEEDEPSVEAIYFDYESGNRSVFEDLHSHTPEACFPATGSTLIEEFPMEDLVLKEQQFLVRQWLFESPAKNRFFVFKIVWSRDFSFEKDKFGPDGSAPMGITKTVRRVRMGAAWQGVDSPATRIILAVVRGTNEREEAWEAFKKVTLDRLALPKR